MDQKPYNILFICSDQHNKFMSGCYGNEHVITPVIDALADRGTLFDHAYTSNPICVPARATIATGCLSSEVHCWDNASPYIGQALSYGHQLEANGIPVTTIGKLHYRADGDDTGFADQRIPLHVRDQIGDLFGTIREYGLTKPIMRKEIPNAHAGDSDYVHYDQRITEEAIRYLEDKKDNDRPWCLYVGYTFPHLPFISPEETWQMYEGKELPMPYSYKIGERTEHPSARDIRDFFGLQEEYPEDDIRKAIRAYYGMCTFLDVQMGQLLGKLRELGMEENTYVIYSSDHGEMMGNHGLWFKNCMLEDSVGIPMIIAGPGIPQGCVNHTNVSLIDIYPTILDIAGVSGKDDGHKRQGISLLKLAKDQEEPDRAVHSEFHASASYTGGFMVRYQQYKYIYYVGYPPQLFDLEKDPKELVDLINDPDYRDIAAMMHDQLLKMGDPDEINATCRSDQEDRLNLHGGREKIRYNFKPIIFSPPPKC